MSDITPIAVKHWLLDEDDPSSQIALALMVRQIAEAYLEKCQENDRLKTILQNDWATGNKLIDREKKLSTIYFNIAVEVAGEERVRRMRNKMINEELQPITDAIHQENQRLQQRLDEHGVVIEKAKWALNQSLQRFRFIFLHNGNQGKMINGCSWEAASKDIDEALALMEEPKK